MLLKFEPLLKSTIWGGNKIIPFKWLGQQLTDPIFGTMD